MRTPSPVRRFVVPGWVAVPVAQDPPDAQAVHAFAGGGFDGDVGVIRRSKSLDWMAPSLIDSSACGSGISDQTFPRSFSYRLLGEALSRRHRLTLGTLRLPAMETFRCL